MALDFSCPYCEDGPCNRMCKTSKKKPMKDFIPVTPTINQDRKYFVSDDGTRFYKHDSNISRGRNEFAYLNAVNILNTLWFPKLLSQKEENGWHITEMEFVHGDTLENLKGVLTDEEKKAIVEQLFKTIGCLTSFRITHGDINESNLIFNRETQQLVLIDFEMATQSVPLNAMLDVSGGVWGVMHILEFLEII